MVAIVGWPSFSFAGTGTWTSSLSESVDMTVERLRLYLRFSHGFVSTECNVGPIINIILLELLVLMAT